MSNVKQHLVDFGSGVIDTFEENELKSLSELGIESLNLNKFTNLNLLVA